MSPTSKNTINYNALQKAANTFILLSSAVAFLMLAVAAPAIAVAAPIQYSCYIAMVEAARTKADGSDHDKVRLIPRHGAPDLMLYINNIKVGHTQHNTYHAAFPVRIPKDTKNITVKVMDFDSYVKAPDGLGIALACDPTKTTPCVLSAGLSQVTFTPDANCLNNNGIH